MCGHTQRLEPVDMGFLSLAFSTLFFLKDGLTLNLDYTLSAILASQFFQESSCLCLHSTGVTGAIPCLTFYMVLRINSGPHACKASCSLVWSLNSSIQREQNKHEKPELAQWVTTLAAKSHGLNSIPRTHVAEGKLNSSKLVSDRHTHTVTHNTHTYTNK